MTGPIDTGQTPEEQYPERSGSKLDFGQDPPFIGRVEETQFIRRRIQEAVRGEGGTVLITGRPGVGKSRLVQEALSEQEQKMDLWDAGALPYGRCIEFFLFQRLLQKRFHLKHKDDENIAREKIERALASLPGFDLKAGVDSLLAAAGYPLPAQEAMDPIQWRRYTERALVQWIEASCQNRPVCLILEDLQWVDPSSRMIVNQLTEKARRLPLFLLLTERSAQQEDDQGTLSTHEEADVIELEPLDEQEGRHLLSRLVSSDSLANMIWQAVSKGPALTPLYLMEALQNLLSERYLTWEKEGWQLKNPSGEKLDPDNLIQMVQNRLNHLDEGSRQLLAAGAVMGQEFSLKLLEFLDIVEGEVQDKLALLEGIGLLQRARVRNGPEYIVRHDLIRQAAERGLGGKQKTLLHSRIVDTIISLYGEDNEPYYHLLAFHALEADMPQTALKYLERSAERARRFHAGREAIECYEKILMLLIRTEDIPSPAEKMIGILLKKSETHLWLGEQDETEQDLKQAAKTLQTLRGRLKRKYRPKVKLGFALWMAFTGRYLEAEKELLEIRSLLEDINDPILEMKRSNLQGLVAWKQGHLKKAVQPLIQCLDWAHRSEMPYFASNAYNNLGLIYGNMGQPRLAIEYHERALKMREEARDEMGQAASHNNLGIIYENGGEYEKAEEYYNRALQLAELTEYREVETAVLANLGQLAENRGQLAKALELNARSLHHAGINGDIRSEAIALDNMGNVNYRLRHYEAAETKYHEALARAGEIGDNTVRSRALLGLCRLYTHQKKLAAAREAWQLARDIIDPCGMEESKPRLFRYLARWLMAENQPKEALQVAANSIESAQSNRHPIEEKACQSVYDEILKEIGEKKS